MDIIEKWTLFFQYEFRRNLYWFLFYDLPRDDIKNILIDILLFPYV